MWVTGVQTCALPICDINSIYSRFIVPSSTSRIFYPTYSLQLDTDLENSYRLVNSYIACCNYKKNTIHNPHSKIKWPNFFPHDNSRSIHLLQSDSPTPGSHASAPLVMCKPAIARTSSYLLANSLPVPTYPFGFS